MYAIRSYYGDGLENKIDPGAPDGSDSVPANLDDSRILPKTLGDAIHAFDQDEVIRNALPAAMADLYRDLKSDEWARFCSAVTDWEKTMYAEYLP